MSDKKQMLSVIIPGYNTSRAFWERCLKSVLVNLGKDDEVICVDDGSDVRPDFLTDLAKADSRIKVIFLDHNAGLPSARNKGLSVACGEFVTFVDSDDEILPGVYADSLSTIKTHNADIAVFGVNSIWVAERLSRRAIPEKTDYGVLSALDVKNLYEDNLLNYAWNKIYRRFFLSSHDIVFDPDGVPCEDVIFVLKCIINKAQWVGVKRVGIHYYRFHNTLLSRYKKTYLKGTLAANRAWRDYKTACDAEKLLGQMGETSEDGILRGEWDNIWRLKSPYSLVARLEFARNYPQLHGAHPNWFFFKKMVYSIFRRWLYIKPIQRWHIKRTYPGVVTV